MKKTILIAFLIYFSNHYLIAQDLGPVRWGIKAGFNFTTSSYKSEQTISTNPFYGGYAGIMMKIPFDNHLHFAPQLDFNYRGLNTRDLNPNRFSKINEVQVRIAPLLQFYLKHPSEKVNSFFIQAGPSIGIGLGGNQTAQNNNNIPLNRKLKYGYQAYGKYDAAWHTGLGYDGKAGFRLLLEYVHGLSNMINTENGPTLKYRTISLGIGYLINK
jgi:hypothetical protein